MFSQDLLALVAVLSSEAVEWVRSLFWVRQFIDALDDLWYIDSPWLTTACLVTIQTYRGIEKSDMTFFHLWSLQQPYGHIITFGCMTTLSHLWWLIIKVYSDVLNVVCGGFNFWGKWEHADSIQNSKVGLSPNPPSLVEWNCWQRCILFVSAYFNLKDKELSLSEYSVDEIYVCKRERECVYTHILMKAQRL